LDDLVLQWQDLYLPNGTQDPVAFQAILFANGNIQFNYQDLDSYPSFGTVAGTILRTGGISSTVGIWNATADALTLPAGMFVSGPHSINGATDSDAGAGTAETNDSYVRMAWDTGGAAWDVGVVQGFLNDGGVNSPEANALRDAFIEELAEQIKSAGALGKVARSDEIVFAHNIGGDAIPSEGFDEDPGIVRQSAPAVDTTSNSIPVVGGMKVDEVFQSTLFTSVGDMEFSYGTVPNGAYIVELFFAPVLPGEFDVIIEGKTLLNNYDADTDRGRITVFDTGSGPSEFELDTTSLSGTQRAGTVKRFLVDVSDADLAAGLQVELRDPHADNPDDAQNVVYLHGIRVLRADPPRIENVVMKGSAWANGVDYSYADVVPTGDQLRPIYQQGIDRIEVHFDGPVTMPANSAAALKILGPNRQDLSQSLGISFVNYDPSAHVATWSLSSALGRGKYAIQLTGVTGSGGAMLDGSWDNDTNGTPDNFIDDPKDRTFLTGDGIEGGQFEFFFSVLQGDYDQNGVVNAADAVAGTVQDGDGDGDVNTDDTAIATSLQNFGWQLARIAPPVDYDDNDIVQVDDYVRWKESFGSTTDLAADGSGNGEIDVDDYVAWRAYYDQAGEIYSAWYTNSGLGIGEGSGPYVQVGVAPTVTNVVVSGSQSTHAPYSFNLHDGSGEQLRTVPVGLPDMVSITFSEDVNIQADHLTFVGLRTANRPALAEFTYDIPTMTATWRFDDLVANDHYAIHLSDAVTDVEGDRLDGEWTNPASLFTTNSLVSEFPSGDGEAGGNFTFVFTLLGGDASRDNVFDMTDVDIFYESWMAGMIEAMFTDGDANGDGYVDSADWYEMASQGLNLQSLWILADLDGDDDVDFDDLGIIYDNAELLNPSLADGDLDQDGDIDSADVDLAFGQLGLAIAAVS
jgi:hypothetical protein